MVVADQMGSGHLARRGIGIGVEDHGVQTETGRSHRQHASELSATEDPDRDRHPGRPLSVGGSTGNSATASR